MSIKMSKFKRKPDEVEAIRFVDDSVIITAIANLVASDNKDNTVRVDYSDPDNPALIIEADDFYACLYVGDYLVKDTDDNLYVWSAALFELTHTSE